MKNYEDEPWAYNYTSTTDDDEDVFDPTKHKMGAEEGHDAEVTKLFVDARDKLEKVEANAIKQKKQIVVDLAKSLEGKIATDTIYMEITNQLRGQVNERTVRAYLDKKYKQKPEVENATKQMKRQQEPDRLAALSLLNREDAENKKEIIVVDVGGSQTMIQDDRKEDDKDADDEMHSISNESPITNDEYNGANPPLIQIQEQQQTQKLKTGILNQKQQIQFPKINTLTVSN